MKRVLITGEGSYIGDSFKKYMSAFDSYAVDSVDMIGDDWKKYDFSGYDAVYHVAGIAHRKETPENAELYFKVNRDLAIETASKAQESGVGQFLFLSSMSVYGMDAGVITKQTVPAPKSNYGKSKLQADEAIRKMNTADFKTVVMRPPMVYGKGCRGNFQALISFARKLPFFPRIKNQRSMIYIDNLCSFVKLMIDREESGVFFPQNSKYSCTSDIVRIIGETMNKKIRLFGWLSPFVKLAQMCVAKAMKAFGTLIYQDTEDFDFSYCVVDEEQSVRRSV